MVGVVLGGGGGGILFNIYLFRSYPGSGEDVVIDRPSQRWATDRLLVKLLSPKEGIPASILIYSH